MVEECRTMDIKHTAQILGSSTKRYLFIDWQYKFLLITDIIWLLLDIVAFAFLGGFLDEKTNVDELGLQGIDMVTFMLLGVLFWAFFHRSYEDTVNTIPEEASRGTIGFLVTNNVSLSTLLISRNIASTIKTTLMTVITILPVLMWVYPAVAGVSDFTEGEGNDAFGGAASEFAVVVGKDITLIPSADLSRNYTYISKAYDGGVGCEWEEIHWLVDGKNATVEVFVRTDNKVPEKGQHDNYSRMREYLPEDTWVEVQSNDTIPGERTNRYIQYMVVISDIEATDKPVLDEIHVTYKDPIIGFVDPVPDFMLLLLVFILAWFFILTVSIFISSFNIVFKRITPFAVMIMYGLKILSGYYFPVEAIDIEGVPEAVKSLPVTAGLYLIRGVMSGHPHNIGGYLSSLIWGTIVMGFIAFGTLYILQKKSQKWGTLEFY